MLASLPVLHILYIVATTGENVISNDLAYYANTIDQIWNDEYAWQNILRDTSIGSHVMLVTVLVRLALAHLSHWNAYAELYFGVGLFIIRTLLIYWAISAPIPTPSRWLILPLLTALVFSTVQINTFTFGETSLALGLVIAITSLGIWGVTRFPSCWLGATIAAVSSLLAAWSWGAGLVTFPMLALGMLLLGYRLRHYLVLAASFGLAITPYLIYVFPSTGSDIGFSEFLHFSPWVNAIGYPFTLGEELIAVGIFGIGLSGLILLGIGLCLMIQNRQKLRIASVPALMVICFGALTAWQVSIARDGLAPWYLTLFMEFWIGLAGFAAMMLLMSSSLQKITKAWAWATLVWLAFLYAMSGWTYTDKIFSHYHLYSRSPPLPPVSAVTQQPQPTVKKGCFRVVMEIIKLSSI